MTDTEPIDRSCWTCRSHAINSPTTFIGNCTCLTKNNPDRCKPVPPEFVDIGCKNWTEKPIKGDTSCSQ